MRVAIIPARGGSKRIPRKNIRPFVGLPIMYYPIQAALDSGLFDEIYVSTDDEEIANVAERYGAHAVKRPAELSDDFTGTQDVVRHLLGILTQPYNLGSIEQACCIYPTAALVLAEDLVRAHGILESSKACFAFSIVEYPCPPEWALYIDEKGRIQAPPARSSELRSQDIKPAWHDAGYFYWGTASAFLEQIPLWGPWSVGVPLPRTRAIDINTAEDWQLAEAAYVLRMQREVVPA